MLYFVHAIILHESTDVRLISAAARAFVPVFSNLLWNWHHPYAASYKLDGTFVFGKQCHLLYWCLMESHLQEEKGEVVVVVVVVVAGVIPRETGRKQGSWVRAPVLYVRAQPSLHRQPLRLR